MAAKIKYTIFEIFNKDIAIRCPNDKVYEEMETKLKRIKGYSLDWFNNNIMKNHKENTVIALLTYSRDKEIKARFGDYDYVIRHKYEVLNIDDIDWNVS